MIIVKNYNNKDWKKLRYFLFKYWSSQHPILKKKLFKWQYKGFGEFQNNKLSKILIDKETKQILGFRGVIPGHIKLIFQIKYI